MLNQSAMRATALFALILAAGCAAVQPKLPDRPPPTAPKPPTARTVADLTRSGLRLVLPATSGWEIIAGDAKDGLDDELTLTDRGNGVTISVMVYPAVKASPILAVMFAKSLLDENQLKTSDIEIADPDGARVSSTFSGDSPEAGAYEGAIVGVRPKAAPEKTVVFFAVGPAGHRQELMSVINGLIAGLRPIPSK